MIGSLPGDVLVAKGSANPALYCDTIVVRADKMNWIAGRPPLEIEEQLRLLRKNKQNNNNNNNNNKYSRHAIPQGNIYVQNLPISNCCGMILIFQWVGYDRKKSSIIILFKMKYYFYL